MKKRFVIPSVLLGALLALPGSALAQTPTYTADDLTINRQDTTDTSKFGVRLMPGGDVGAWDGTGFTGINYVGAAGQNGATGQVYKIGNVTSTFADDIPAGNGLVGVFTNDTAGKFTFGDITAAGNKAGVMYGFLSQGSAANFTGTFSAGTINVNLKDTAGDIIGLGFGYDDAGTLIWTEIQDSVTVDAIKVSGGAGATGMVLGAIADGETVKIGSVNATSAGNATGVIFSDQWGAGLQDSSTGNLLVDNIEVTAGTGAAFGLRANGVLQAEATLGDITATSNTGDAYGIVTDNDTHATSAISNITLKGNVIADSKEGDAYGIVGESVEFTVANTGKVVQILGNASGAGIQTTGTAGVTANLAKDANLYTENVNVGNGNIALDGPGSAKVVGVQQTGTGAIDITGGAQAIVHYTSDSTFGIGAKTIGEGSSATIYADDIDSLQPYLAQVGGAGTMKVRAENGGADIINGDIKVLDTNFLANGFVAAASMHQRYSAWNATRDQMISAGANRRGFLGQECDPCDPICDTNPCDPCDPCGKFGFGGAERSLARNAWVNYVGRADEYDSVFNGGKWKLGMDGVQVGTDLYKTSRNQFGVIFGYEGGDLTNSYSLDRVDADDIYAGIYGAHVFSNGFDLRGTFAYGWQDYTMVRQNLGADRLFGSKFDGNTTESTVEIGKRFFNGNWSMRPVFGIDVMSNELDAAKETLVYGPANGTAYNYGKTDFTQVFLRAGTDLRWQLRRLTFNSGIYYSYDVNGEDLIGYAQNGVNTPIKMVGSDMGRELLTFNVGGEYQFNNFSVFGGYQGQAVLDTKSDAYQSIGYVGGAWKW